MTKDERVLSDEPLQLLALQTHREVAGRLAPVYLVELQGREYQISHKDRRDDQASAHREIKHCRV